MDVNSGEMTGLSKDIIFSNKLRKKNGTLSSVCNSRLGRLESPESCHEAKVQQATLPINKRFLWGFLMRHRNCI